MFCCQISTTGWSLSRREAFGSDKQKPKPFWIVFWIWNLCFGISICFSQKLGGEPFDKLRTGPGRTIDSLLNVLKIAHDDTNKVNTLNVLSDKLGRTGDYDKAMQYAMQAITLAEQISLPLGKGRGWAKGIASSLGNIGNIYYQQGDYPKALDQYFKSLKIKEKLGNKKGIANSLNNIGLIYFEQGDYPKALDQDFKSLKIREEIGDKQGIANTINNIGLIYYEQGDYRKALMQHFKSLKIREEIGDKQGIASSLTNIGVSYHAQGDSAFAMGNTNFALADRYPKALAQYDKALKIKEEIGDKDGIASSYINLGSINIKLKKFSEARKYLDDALSLSKEIGNKDDIKDSYSGLSALDSTTGNWRSAYEHHRQYIMYRDRIFN